MAKKHDAPRHSKGSRLEKPQAVPMPVQINAANRDYWSDAPGRAEARLMDAQQVIAKLHGRVQMLLPAAERDERRQEGTRKERRPKISTWICEQLARTPDVKSPELWRRAPDWITDQIGQRAFAKRVTDARKVTRK